MRSPLDRLRHALSFEIIALILVVPFGAMAFGQSVHAFGVVALASATIATAWNYVYNLGFDIVHRRLFATTQKTMPGRLFHAVLFELGLLIALMPFIAWYLGVTLWQAFVMDVSLALFYVVYALVFNLAYDRLFPLPEWASAARGERPS